VEIWGARLKNMNVVHGRQYGNCTGYKQTSKDQTIMKLVRRLVLATLKHNIHFRAKHIPGKHNITADRLSRFQFQEAFQSAPQLNRLQTQIPPTSLYI
jgi:hypothetical protein